MGLLTPLLSVLFRMRRAWLPVALGTLSLRRAGLRVGPVSTPYTRSSLLATLSLARRQRIRALCTKRDRPSQREFANKTIG